MSVEYSEWIRRERRIRVKILKGSSQISKTKLYRVCLDCGEVVLCHEQSCPNCRMENIAEEHITDIDSVAFNRIRCRYRFDHLSKTGEELKEY